MRALWVWGRRLVLGGISVVFAFSAWAFLQMGRGPSDFGTAAIFGLLSFLAGWVAVFGGGQVMSMGDDRKVHGERMRRYK